MPYRLLFYTHQKCDRKGKQRRQSRVLQPTLLGTKIREPIETCYRPQLSKSVSHNLKIQNGNPRVNPRIPKTGGMDHFHRSVGRILAPPYPPTIKKISEVPSQGGHIPVHKPTLWASHSTTGLHFTGKRGQIVSTKTGHSTTPVPGRLAHQSSVTSRIPEAYSQSALINPVAGLHGKSPELRTHSSTEVQLHRVPFFTGPGACQTHR